ncbi:MAG: peptidoglycan DD-metalloendopeptidase family protein [Hyphomicrobiaceae bacterium]|nr:peptidoglycan DD-metalloendopeptidase family protein [Hyphomicrobiaceae bacterium]
MLRWAVLLAGCSPLAVTSARAQAPQPGETAPAASEAARKDAALRLEAQRARLTTTQDRVDVLQNDVKSIDRERDRLNARLLETAALIQKSEARLSETEARLGELEAQERIVRGSLMQRYGELSKLLGVLQRMGRNPPPVMITKREDALAMVRSAILLASAFPGMQAKALELSGKLDELVRVSTQIRDESERIRSETQRLSDGKVRLAGLMAQKKQSLSERQAELETMRRTADALSRDVKDLNDLLGRLDRAVSESEAVKAYNARAAEQVRQAEAREAAQRSGPVPASPPVTGDATPEAARGPLPVEGEIAGTGLEAPAKPADPGQRVVVLAPMSDLAGKSGANRIEPAVPFHLAKGRLPQPTQGKQVLAFGEATKHGPPSKGIVYETRHAGHITSPCDGWVVYAGEFRSYGQLLIINAGGGYHVLLAGLSRIDVQPGQFVLSSEPVGIMAEAPQSLVKEPGAARQQAAQAPVLYVEFRKDGRPVDPTPWWVSGPQKVQG